MTRFAGACCVASLVLADSPRALASTVCDDDTQSLVIGQSAQVVADMQVEIAGCEKKSGCKTWFLICWEDKYEVAQFRLEIAVPDPKPGALPGEAECTFTGAAETILATSAANVFTAPSSGQLRCGPAAELTATLESDARASAEAAGYDCSADARPRMRSCSIDIEVLP